MQETIGKFIMALIVILIVAVILGFFNAWGFFDSILPNPLAGIPSNGLRDSVHQEGSCGFLVAKISKPARNVEFRWILAFPIPVLRKERPLIICLDDSCSKTDDNPFLVLKSSEDSGIYDLYFKVPKDIQKKEHFPDDMIYLGSVDDNGVFHLINDFHLPNYDWVFRNRFFYFPLESRFFFLFNLNNSRIISKGEGEYYFCKNGKRFDADDLKKIQEDILLRALEINPIISIRTNTGYLVRFNSSILPRCGSYYTNGLHPCLTKECYVYKNPSKFSKKEDSFFAWDFLGRRAIKRNWGSVLWLEEGPFSSFDDFVRYFLINYVQESSDPYSPSPFVTVYYTTYYGGYKVSIDNSLVSKIYLDNPRYIQFDYSESKGANTVLSCINCYKHLFIYGKEWVDGLLPRGVNSISFNEDCRLAFTPTSHSEYWCNFDGNGFKKCYRFYDRFCYSDSGGECGKDCWCFKDNLDKISEVDFLWGVQRIALSKDDRGIWSAECFSNANWGEGDDKFACPEDFLQKRILFY